VGAAIVGYAWVDVDTGIVSTLGRLAIGLAIVLGGALMIWLSRTPLQFDRRSGIFSRGRQSDKPLAKALTPYQSCALEDIHALQILVKRKNIGGVPGGAYLSYELNLVLANGTRMNVLDHGDGAAVRKDAATLAQFLSRPVWDATEGR
jgi:hypothetical protein